MVVLAAVGRGRVVCVSWADGERERAARVSGGCMREVLVVERAHRGACAGA